MTAERSRYWPQIARLRTDLRDEVMERAAIKITHAGMAPEQADAEALAETVPGWAPGLFDGWEEE
jgi:hypothetical protein